MIHFQTHYNKILVFHMARFQDQDLFSIYINDICNARKHFVRQMTLYKIDTNNRNRSINKINHELVKLNVDKSVFMIYQHSRKDIRISQIKIDGNEIKMYNILIS